MARAGSAAYAPGVQPPHAGATDAAAGARDQGALRGTMARYLAGSVVATVCSEVVFVLLYGPAGAGTTLSSLLGWLAGAIPNYWLNRRWAWRRTGPVSLRRELVPYVAIIVVTLLLAVVATGAADHLVGSLDLSDRQRWAVVGGTFLGVYGVVFVLRFALLDRLFRRPTTGPAQRSPHD